MDVTPEKTYAVVATLIFAGFVAITLLGALVAASTQRLVRSVSGLALSFVGLAGLYYYLHNPFLALMQILVYVGAICVAIMFAMMLADLQEGKRSPVQAVLTAVLSLLAAVVFGAPLLLLAVKGHWLTPVVQTQTGTINELGSALLTRYSLAFELISGVLLVAILGALVVARSGRGTKQ